MWYLHSASYLIWRKKVRVGFFFTLQMMATIVVRQLTNASSSIRSALSRHLAWPMTLPPKARLFHRSWWAFCTGVISYFSRLLMVLLRAYYRCLFLFVVFFFRRRAKPSSRYFLLHRGVSSTRE